MVNADTHLLQLPKTLKCGVILHQQSLLLSAWDIEFLGFENLLCNKCPGKPVEFLHWCCDPQPWQITPRDLKATLTPDSPGIPAAGIPAHQSTSGSLNTSPSLRSWCTATCLPQTRAGSASSHHHSCTTQNDLCYFVRNICSPWHPSGQGAANASKKGSITKL